MAKFLVQNLTKKALHLGIEPWADVELLAPGAKAECDYDEPADVEFVHFGDGSASVGVMSERVSVSANGCEKTFKSPKGNW
jgi:hypothetical protein